MTFAKTFFLVSLLSLGSSATFANCTFNTSKYLSQLQEPSTIQEIRVEVPKSAKFAKNFIEILTSRTRNIPPALKKNFEAQILVDYKFGNCEFSARVRQTGDWKDHIFLDEGEPVRSLNVTLREGNILNAVKFKLLIPKTRNDLNEVLGSLVARELGFIAPETFQVQVDVNGSRSMMLFQEDARKELLERNLRREGPMFEGDESLLWTNGQPTIYREDISLARLMNQKWFLGGQSSQYITLTALAELQNAYLNYTNYKNKALLLFPNNKEFEDFHFLMYTMNGWHALRPHNRRFYFNSFTTIFEPIYYDGNLRLTVPVDLSETAARPSTEDLSFTFKNDYIFPFTRAVSTPNFKSELLFKFENRVLRFNDATQTFFKESLSQLHANMISLQTKIKELEAPISPRLGDSNQYELYTSRVSKRDIGQKHVSSIQAVDKDFLLTYRDTNAVTVSPEALGSILSKNLLGDVRHVFLPENSMDLDLTKNGPHFEGKTLIGGSLLSSPNILVNIKESEKLITISQSNPTDWVLFRNVDLSDWQVNFRGLPVIEEGASLAQRFNIHGMTGCLNFYNSIFNHTSIKVVDGQCEDSLNIINSSGQITSVEIENAYSDAIDFDFSQLILKGIAVHTAGNDCLDVSSGTYKINHAFLANCGDKALSVGEKSKLDANDISINSAYIGMSVKDFSSLIVTNAKIKDVTICTEATQKKQEFGGAIATLGYIECAGQYLEDENSSLSRSGN